MTKFVSGLLIGFFLAVGLMAGYVQITLGPHYETVKMAQPYAQGIYNLAHGGAYTEMQTLAAKINDAAAAISQMPFIGATFDKAKVSQYTQMAMDTLKNAKDSSEVMLSLVNMTIGLIELSLPLLVLSVIMIGVGYWMYYKEGNSGKKGRKK